MCMNKNDPFAALITVAQDQQGYFTTKQAIEAGYADNTHPYHVHAGNWERVRRGIYWMSHFPPPEDGEMMAWLLWSRGRDEKPVAAMSHQTALRAVDNGSGIATIGFLQSFATIDVSVFGDDLPWDHPLETKRRHRGLI